jgi:redox-sensitive bicupin YhaK (pirin superfamily)
VDGIAADPCYLDVWIPPGREKTLPVPVSFNAFAYVFEGAAHFGSASPPLPVQTETIDPEGDSEPRLGNRSLVPFDHGDGVRVRTGDEGCRFLLVSGKPLGEPVAWRGPIVMNTQDELRRAFEELDQGTFIKANGAKTK